MLVPAKTQSFQEVKSSTSNPTHQIDIKVTSKLCDICAEEIITFISSEFMQQEGKFTTTYCTQAEILWGL